MSIFVMCLTTNDISEKKHAHSEETVTDYRVLVDKKADETEKSTTPLSQEPTRCNEIDVISFHGQQKGKLIIFP